MMGRPQPHHTTFYARGFTGAETFGHHTPRGSHGAVDVVVATPGRLIDHLENTPGFTLEHLRCVSARVAAIVDSVPWGGFWCAQLPSTYTHAPSYARTHALAHIHTCTRTYIPTYIHTLIHTHTHEHMHTYDCTRTHSGCSSWTRWTGWRGKPTRTGSNECTRLHTRPPLWEVVWSPLAGRLVFVHPSVAINYVRIF